MRAIRPHAAIVTGAVICLLLAVPGSALAAPGDIDASFGASGKVTTDIGSGNDVADAVAVQADGMIVAAGHCLIGSTANFCLTRYNANGSLDPSFDSDGKIATAVDARNDQARAVAVQTDGKIVAAGNCGITGDADFCLARYNGNGSLDTSFDGDGKVITVMSAGSDSALAITVQGDGRIVVAGECFVNSQWDFCLARYNGNGSLDTSFDGDGKVTTAVGAGNDQATSVAFQADGKIVAAGYCTVGATVDFCLTRYSGNGSLDASFDGDGKVTTAIGAGSDQARGVAVQADGKIVAAGQCAVGATVFCLARYTSNGSVDATFDGDGNLTTAIGTGAFAGAVVVQSDGKIVAAGGCIVGGVASFCLARYSGSGSLDPTFDGDGTVTTAIGTGAFASAVVVQPDGRIVPAGNCTVGATADFCLARYEGTPPAPPVDEVVVKRSGFDPSQPLSWIDPAVTYFSSSWQLGYATCLPLLNYGEQTGVLGPDAATAMPVVSPDGKTYTFTVAAGHKFSDGTAVDAASFKLAIERATSPAMVPSAGAPARSFVSDIVGAAAHFSAGGGISGIGAVGNLLSITLVAPAGDFPSRLAMPFFCATRSTAPATPSVSPLPSAGPYFVETASSSEIVLKRNPFYGGSRLRDTATIRWVPDSSPLVGDYVPQAAATSVVPLGGTSPTNTTSSTFYLALNTSKPPFNAINARRAAALAVDRTAVSAISPIPWLPTDQFLAPGMPGYQAANLFNLTADTAGAITQLAGATPAVTLCHRNAATATAQAAALEVQLEAAGFVVTRVPLSSSDFLNPSPTGPGPANPANCNLAPSGWAPNSLDPGAVLSPLFAGSSIPPSGFNVSFFSGEDAAFAAAAAATNYASRVTALGALDVTLAGTDIPAVALGDGQQRDVFAARIGCLVFNPLYGYALNRLCVPVGGIVAPSGLVATALSRSQIGLVWSDNAANESGFRIERSFDGSSGWHQIATVAANVTAFVHARQPSLTTYFYRVRATNAVGDSAYSNVASATTLA